MIVNPQQLILKKAVYPTTKKQWQPNSIDLTVESISLIEGTGKVLVDKVELPTTVEVCTIKQGTLNVFNLSPGVYSVMFAEWVKVPKNMCACIICRSSLNRCGSFITTGLYDSGFNNKIGAILRVARPIQIERGARIATIYFMTAAAMKQYTGQYQGKV